MIDIKVLASSSSGNCYLIDDGETKLLLEAGISLKRIQKGTAYQVTSVAGCLVTHEHQDHSKAVNDLMGIGIDCYMSKGTAAAINAQDFRCKEIMPNVIVDIGTWLIKPFDTRHDASEPFGYLLYSNNTGERLVFITDSYYVPYKFADLNYIMVECNYSDEMLNRNFINGSINEARRKRIMRSHMSLENCKELLRANDLSKVKEIHLLHLSDENSVEDQFKKEIAALTGLPVYVAQK